MNSEKEISEDLIKKEKDSQPENYTINMKVNLKNFNQQNSRSLMNLNSHRNFQRPKENTKKDDILVISEEIYQKRLSKVR